MINDQLFWIYVILTQNIWLVSFETIVFLYFKINKTFYDRFKRIAFFFLI